MPLMGFLVTSQGLEKGLMFLGLGELYFLQRVRAPEVTPLLGREYPLEAAHPNMINLVFRAFLSSLPTPGK